MNKEYKIKYLDLIIKNINDVDFFDPYIILLKKTELEEKEAVKTSSSVRQFAITYDIFEKNGTGQYWKLTERGNELKDFGKGFEKFLQNETKKPWYNENWVGFALAFIVFSFTVYQHFEKRNLTNQVSSLEKERDSLKTQVDFHKSAHSGLKAELEKNKESIK